MKKILKVLFSRLAIVSFLIIIEFIFLTGLLYFIKGKYVYVSIFVDVISLLVMVIIINRTQPPSTKIPWIVVVAILPMGWLIYLFFGWHMLSNKTNKKFHTLNDVVSKYYYQKTKNIDSLEAKDLELAGQSKYLKNTSDCPVFQKTEVKYLSSGEKTFSLMIEKLENAKKFIFLEYFIIEPGKFWNTILEVLERKVKEGLDVRVMYDDIGCIKTLPLNYYKILNKKGIKCVPFNKFIPIVSAVHNNRDHRKIMVIDGDIAFNGGINLADEYINEKKVYGYWKDSCVYLRGEAVKSFTIMFLENWNVICPTDENYDKFTPYFYERKVYESDGYIQPYCDGPRPIYDDRIGETAYLNIINNAEKYVYITTPYLVIDYHIIQALRNAAQRGVDVRIIVPHIPDKKIVFWLTRSNYYSLVSVGVKIYEYTPGFIHAKNFVCDDKVAIVGTINLDYRSLSHHFECATWMGYSSAVGDVKKDFLNTIVVSEEITLSKCKKITVVNKVLSSIIGLFAPLM